MKNTVKIGEHSIELNSSEQLTLCKVKSLLNGLRYIIRDDHKSVVGDYYDVVRKLSLIPDRLSVPGEEYNDKTMEEL